MVKRSVEQNLRILNFEPRNGNYETNAVVKNQGTKLGDCWQWEANGQCSKGDNCSFRHDMNKCKIDTAESFSKIFYAAECEKMHREPGVLEAEAQVEECLDCRAFREKWHPPECLFYKSENGCRFGDKCSYAHRQVDERPSKRSKKNGDKSAVAMLKITRQLGCVSQDMEPAKSSSILRKSSNILKPIRCVRFTNAVVRHANIRNQNPSLGMICPGDPHQRNANPPKFEDRSQEETQWQELCAREAAWKLAKKFIKIKGEFL